MRAALARARRFVLFGVLLPVWALYPARLNANARLLNEVVFVGSSDWAILHPGSIKADELLIRRYTFKVSRSSYSATRNDPLQKLELIDPPGTIVNSMFLNCRRKRNETDFLVLHLPDTITLSSFSYDDWKSSIQIKTLADGESRSVRGEYIKGDLFIDFKDMEAVDFIKLMTSNELMFEFGDRADRGQLIFSEKTGATKMQQFIRAVLPELAKSNGAQRVQFLNTSQALAACLHFKKTGRP